MFVGVGVALEKERERKDELVEEEASVADGLALDEERRRAVEDA